VSQRGLNRERRLRQILAEDGWVVVRGSKGVVDLVLLKAGDLPRLVQVKSTAQGPYERFGPDERAELVALAEAAGGAAFLIWWPPKRGWKWIASTEFPGNDRKDG
jgi:Holliday junction resolvase